MVCFQNRMSLRSHIPRSDDRRILTSQMAVQDGPTWEISAGGFLELNWKSHLAIPTLKQNLACPEKTLPPLKDEALEEDPHLTSGNIERSSICRKSIPSVVNRWPVAAGISDAPMPHTD